jgi:hypothetical protein
VLDAASDNADRLPLAVRETTRLGIEVLAPDVNSGAVSFSASPLDAEEEAIRFGMAAVKNVGAGAVSPIVEERTEAGEFKSLEDMCKRVKFKGMNRRTLESLAKVGAFDSIGSRGGVLEAIERLLALIQHEARLRDSGQTTMFDMLGDEVPTPTADLQLSGEDDVSDSEKILWERELLGVELTESPFTREMHANADRFKVFANQITADLKDQKIAMLGQIRRIRELSTRKGDAFLAVHIGMLDGEVEIVVWPNVLETTRAMWEDGKFVTIMGTVRERDNRVSVAVDTVTEYKFGEAGEGAATPAAPAVAGIAAAPATAPTSAASYGSNGNGNGRGVVAEAPARPPATQNGSYHVGVSNGNGNGHAAPVVPSGTIIVRVTETDQAREDRFHLDDMVKTLLDFRGEDYVTLEIKTAHEVISMDMPFIKVRTCPELMTRLTEMLGEGNVSAVSA